jgi:hypothetical protein
MNMKLRSPHSILIWIFILGLVLAACTLEQQPDPEQVAMIVALTQTAAASEISEALEETVPEPTEAPGLIYGLAYGFAPPTPPLVVYAVDETTGKWSFVETPQTDGQTAFSLEMPPGNYLIFACPVDLENCAFGYSEDGWALSPLSVAAGETIYDILVRPPAMGECGPTMSIPASPDGRFRAVEPSTEDCPISGELQPLSSEACAELATASEQTLGIAFAITDVSIEKSWSEQTGRGCQLMGSGDGNNFENLIGLGSVLNAMMLERGWLEQLGAPMCLGHGGWGPTGSTSCWVKDSQVCEAFTSVAPADKDLCDGIEGPINECLAVLAPEQIIYTASLTCAQDFTVPEPTVAAPEHVRVEFASGEMSTQVFGELAPNEIDRYVLTAMEGQQLNTYLYPSGLASIVIWGADGSVLISDHADATSWFGPLPFTQDYFIDVKSLDNNPIDYALDIVIPPPTNSGATGKICFPSEMIPAMTVYFEDTMNGLITTVPIAENQSTYEVSLEPGTYLAYAWLPDFTIGGLYSYAVPCGLSVECTDHDPIVVQITPDQTVTNIDICDWYLDQSLVPQP